MSSQADLGQKALAAKNYDAAIKHYTEALKSSNSPLWLTQRSTAYQRSGNHDLALLDAEDAVLQAISRGKRELIAAAQMRRAIALYGLGRYGDARLCFTWVRKLNEKEPGVGTWQAMAMKEYEKLDADAEARKVTIKETPDKVMRAAPEAEESKIETPASASANTQKEVQVVAPAQTPKEKIRHEWFQSNDKVTITIFAKGVPKDKAEVNFGPESLEVNFPTVSGSDYDFTLSPLFSTIDTIRSTYNITPYKVEISLHKMTSGLKWSALEGTQEEADTAQKSSSYMGKIGYPAPSICETAYNSTIHKAPAYPTSSRNGPKDWDALAKDALKKEKQASGADPATIDDDDIEGGDPVQGFFKKIYKDADPDTQRAMMKSFVESNGTALSTDWGDVGSKTVPISPPDGIEAKKWET